MSQLISAITQGLRFIFIISIAYALMVLFLPYISLVFWLFGRIIAYLFFPVIFLSQFIYTPNFVYVFYGMIPVFILSVFGRKLGIRLFSKK